MNIDVGSDGLPILDVIVLSFVIFTRVTRQQPAAKAANAAVTVAAAAASSANGLAIS